MSKDWLVGDTPAVAASHILDAAGRCFMRAGAAHTTIGDIASEAGCSRMTVYRYFDDRDALRLAFAHREVRRIGAEVAVVVRDIADPAERLLRAVVETVTKVRADPVQMTWFRRNDLRFAQDFCSSSQVLETMVVSFLGEPTQESLDKAQFLIRMILSLLILPAQSGEHEEHLIREFVVPTVLSRPSCATADH